MNKKLSIVLIVLLSTLLAFVVGIMVFLFKGGVDKLNFNFSSFSIGIGGTSNKLVDSKEIENIKPLDIEFDVADVDVLTSESNTIKVELYSDDPGEYEITESENTIKVVLKEKENIKFSFNKKINKIKVYIPMNYTYIITVNGTTGDINMDDFSSASTDITLKTGDIKIKEINFASIGVTTGDIEIGSVYSFKSVVTTGDIEIGTARLVDIVATTGDIDIKEVDTVNVQVTTGDIDIYKVNEYLNLQATTGDIDIDTVNIKTNSKIKVTTGDIKIKNARNIYVSGTAKVGDVNIKGVDRRSDIELNIEAKIGDIRVN